MIRLGKLQESGGHMQIEISNKTPSDLVCDLEQIGYNLNYFTNRGIKIVITDRPHNLSSVFVELGMQIQRFATKVGNPWIVLTSYALLS